MTGTTFASYRQAQLVRQFTRSHFGCPAASPFEIVLSLVLAALGVTMAGYLVFVGT